MQDEGSHVVEVITACLAGSVGRWDWHHFTSSPLRDAELDRIRQCAAAVRLPLDFDGRAVLQELLVQAELLIGDDPASPKPWRIGTGAIAGLLAGAIVWWISYLPGDSLFRNLHLILLPPALGAFVVVLRNSRKKVGAYEPKIVAQNRKGRV